MSKMTDTTKTVLSIFVSLLVLAGAVTAWATTRAIKAQVDSTQDERIFRAEENIVGVKGDVSTIKIKAAEELGVKNAIFDSLRRMEAAQETQTAVVGKLAIDMATVKAQVDNLEKAD